MQNSAQGAPTTNCSSFPPVSWVKALQQRTPLSPPFCLSPLGCPDWEAGKRQGTDLWCHVLDGKHGVNDRIPLYPIPFYMTKDSGRNKTCCCS